MNDELALEQHPQPRPLDRRRRITRRRRQCVAANTDGVRTSPSNARTRASEGVQLLSSVSAEGNSILSITDEGSVIIMTNACQGQDNILPTQMLAMNGHIIEEDTEQLDRQKQKQKRSQNSQPRRLHQQKNHQHNVQRQQQNSTPRKRRGRRHQTHNPQLSCISPSLKDTNDNTTVQPNSTSQIDVSNIKNLPTINKVNPRRNRHRTARNRRSQQNNDVNTNVANDGNFIRYDKDCNNNSGIIGGSGDGTTIKQTTGTITTDGNSLASKLKHSLEREKHQQQIMEEQVRSRGGGGVHLTPLTSSSRPFPSSLPSSEYEEEVSNKQQDEHHYDTSTPTVVTSAAIEGASPIIPNAKVKWSNAELSKMRHRWWEALRLERTKKANDATSRGDQDNGDNESEDEDDSSSSSSSTTSLDDVPRKETYNDLMEPPSLSTPFDEGYPTRSMIPPIISSTILPSRILSPKNVPPQPIIDLVQLCIESPFPLHCVIYNHALCHVAASEYNDDNTHHYTTIPTIRVKSDTEVVLHRLLTMQDIDTVLRWKGLRTGLADMRGLEANGASHSQTGANILIDAAPPLLSADTTSLTPLQLAVYWNLPDIIRLLCTAGVQSPTLKNSVEEDEKCRTPLMLACELGHVACIKTIMCLSTCNNMLKRRERVGGNSAFHFCCIGSSSSECNRKSHGIDDDDDYGEMHNVSRRSDTIDALLQYTPTKDHKIALLSTNQNGQNIFHMACSRGDVSLLERLLEMHILPGVNIAKALGAKDSLGYTPFLTAIVSDS